MLHSGFSLKWVYVHFLHLICAKSWLKKKKTAPSHHSQFQPSLNFSFHKMISRWRWTASGLHWQFFRLLPLCLQVGSRGPLLCVSSGTFLTKNILFQVVSEENYRISNIWRDLHCFHTVCVCVLQLRSTSPSGRLAGESMKRFKMPNGDNNSICLRVFTVIKWSDVPKEIKKYKSRFVVQLSFIVWIWSHWWKE